eukprot:3297722-Pyramimonas_sp.AAC.1
MPSSLSGKFIEEVECDLMFYKQHIVFRIIDRCTRWAAGQQVADKAMHAMLDAYHQCWIQRGLATAMHSAGE